MKVRFLRDVQVEAEGRNKGPVYKAGSEHDFSLESAQRWLRRGVAVEVTVAARRIVPERPMMRAPEPKPEPESNAEAKLASDADEPKKRGRKPRG